MAEAGPLDDSFPQKPVREEKPGGGEKPAGGEKPGRGERPGRGESAGRGAKAVREEPVAGERLSRRSLRDETLLVLALSLGASGVSALISFIGSVTRPGGLKDQAATLNASAAPGRPWLDLTWQLFGITTALVPVALVAHFLLREGRSLRTLGFDRGRPWPDLARGAAVAAVIGSTGIAFYLAARGLGFNLTVVPEALPEVWWKYPVLILSAVQNSVLEEVIVVGYLLRRLDQLGWSPGASLAASSVLRGSYHLYQGIGGFIGNMVMGVVFVYLYRRWGRVGPLVVAHSLLDIGAFVGYALLAGKVDWLPTA
ncbi:CPBP family intramembrane glutamic endopeptidase [Streptomyces sp. NPDC017454]|uniref:CPBP family intramembrane glutamic endopeptidase n=1 Tax=Streptomyces sp. NPDC017454 TaxID=3364997 RepID=UPI0037A1ACD7